ncbi:MAG: P-type conjugative transfer protein TrbG [Pseudomonadota bacterium]|nr:P-type conjugative transfer protein TrbG [Pseudomonadota bacterium]
MKKLAFTLILLSAATYAQQPAVNVPALEPAAPINLQATQAPASAPPATQAPAIVAAPPVVATATPPATTTRRVQRPRRAARNDDLNGFRYPPAREAAEKSTRWANMTNAMVAGGPAGRVTVVYGQSVPKIACAYLRVCSVELEAGETVNKVDAGDPVRWSISPSIVGEGANRTVYVIIKPKSDEAGLFTNLKIATNRRMYDLDIFSVSGEQFVRQIAFSYPENDQRAWEAQRVAMAKEDAIVTADLPSVGVERLNFNYSLDGDYPHRPVRVFDDGDKTYIQMGVDFRTQEAPVLVLIGSDGKEQLVNYRLKNGYFMVDKIFEKAALLVGVGGNQQKVVISRGCAKRTFFGGCVAG